MKEGASLRVTLEFFKEYQSPYFQFYVSDLKEYLGVDDDTPKLVNSCINCRMYADDLISLI